MERYQGRHDVLLIDWSRLSFFQQNFVDGLPKELDFMGDTKKLLGNSQAGLNETLQVFLDAYQVV